jgi:hypothetical protein
MAMGIASQEEFELELLKLSNGNGSKNGARIVSIEKGRGPKEETPESVRKVIAESAIEGANASELAKTFNVSESSVSAYKNGATSTASYNEPDKSLNKHVNDVKGKIVVRANKKLMRALGNMTDDKFADAKLRDLAGIAKDMSAIVRNLEPSKENDSDNKVQFIFFAPQMRKESDYPVIDISADA